MSPQLLHASIHRALSGGVLAGVLLAATLTADDFSSTGRGIDGPPTLAASDRGANSANALAEIDPSTGAVRAGLPFLLPAARGRAQPSLALAYNSAVGLGVAGVGWSLSLPSIERRGATGFPKFVDDPTGRLPASMCSPDVFPLPATGPSCADRFYLAGQPLVAICDLSPLFSCGIAHEDFPGELLEWTYFRKEVDDGSRIFWSPDRQTWIVQTHAGVTSSFGRPLDLIPAGHGLEHAEALFRIADPTSPVPTNLPKDVSDVYRWNLVRMVDLAGNTVVFRWDVLAADSTSGAEGMQYLTDIFDTSFSPDGDPRGPSSTDLTRYAHHTHLRWSTPDESTKIITQSPLWRGQSPLRLVGVDITSKPSDGQLPRELVRRYHLEYTWNPSHTRPFLTSFQLEGRCPGSIVEDAQGLLPPTPCDRRAPTTLEYTSPPLAAKVSSGVFGIMATVAGPIMLKDIDGDALPELLYLGGQAESQTIFTGKPNTGDRTEMESRTSSTRVAKIQDIAPGATHAAFGNFLQDGRIDAVFVNPGNLNPGPAVPPSLEIYALDTESKKWLGQGPSAPPMFFPRTFWQPDPDVFAGAGRLINIDVDGDGLTDILLPDEGVPKHNGWRAYLTALDTQGRIQPFAERPAPTCIPHVAGALLRVMADFDGDGLSDFIEFEDITGSGPSTFPQWRIRAWKSRGDGRFGMGDISAPDDCQRLAGHEIATAFSVSQSMRGALVDKTAALHDIDGDGLADLVVASEDGLDVLTHARSDNGIDNFETEFHSQFLHISAKDANLSKCWPVSPGPDGKFDPKQIALLFADVNATGVDDLVVVDGFGRSCIVSFTGDQRPGLLSSISNGYGITTRLEYDTVANLDRAAQAAKHGWKTKLPVPARVVTRAVTVNNLPGIFAQSYESTYSYVDPLYDSRDRTFVGFREVTATRPGDGTAPGTRTHTTFLTGACVPNPDTRTCDSSDDYVYRITRGLPGLTEVMTLDETANTHLITTMRSYPVETLYLGEDLRKVRRVWSSGTGSYVWDATKQDSQTRTETFLFGSPADGPLPSGTFPVVVPVSAKPVSGATKFDEYGNLIAVIDWGDITDPNNQPIITRLSWTLPTGDATRWAYRPISQSVGYGDFLGNIVKLARQSIYTWSPLGLLLDISGQLSGTAPLDRHHSSGGAVAPLPSVASVDGTILLASLEYDKFGNLTRSRMPNGRCADVRYDATHNQLPVTQVTYLHGCASPDPFITQFQFDRGLEVLVGITRPDSRVAGLRYDSFGRLAEVDQPDATSIGQLSPFPAMTVDYSLAETGPIRKVKTRQIFGSGPNPAYAERWAYFDGFGRTLAVLAESEVNGRWIVDGLTQRTTNGRIARLFEPAMFEAVDGSTFPMSVPPRDTQYTYDELGRPLTTTTFDGRTTTYKHRPLDFAVDIFDPEQVAGAHAGSFTTLTMDLHGRRTAIEQHFAKDPLDTITTLFTYESTGELLTRSETHSANPKEIILDQAFYDTLGRRVRNIEVNSSVADSGNPSVVHGWTYAYNDNGELVGTSDARGCGKNLLYDNIGRLVLEDYSPCTAQQDAYSPPDPATGSGAEVLNLYDVPLSPSGTNDDLVYRGRLVATFDRAERSDVVLDARGRVNIIRRQLAVPGAASRPISERYAPRVYQKLVLENDEANRAVTVTTGASTPELRPPNVGSWIKAAYTPRGTISGILSSYGDLITNQQFDAFGYLRARVLGDAARTTWSAVYDDGGPLKGLGIMRLPGPWLPASATYEPPDPGEPNTLQGVLTLKRFDYDGALNPTRIADFAAGDDWPGGAVPAALKVLAYDDAYHLRSVDTKYAITSKNSDGDDAFVSPLAAEQDRGDTTFPSIIGATNRVRNELFKYDWAGNTTLADDDAHLFDRSPGTITPSAQHPHQIGSVQQVGVQANPSYDEAGNVTRLDIVRDTPCDGRCPARYQYSWDEVGRLLSARRFDSVGSDVRLTVTIGYTHSWTGSRVLRRVESSREPSRTTADVFDTLRLEGAQFLDGDYELTAGTERVRLATPAGDIGEVRFVSPDPPSKSAGRTRVFLVLGDHLGSTSFVIDRETGELVEKVAYEAFGTTESDYRPRRWGNYRDNVHYTGHLDEVEVGLVHFGARMYMPALGRWASPDPLPVHTLSGDMNAYAMVHGSPMRFVDPIGLDTFGCDNQSPGCGGFGEEFPGDGGVVAGPSAGGVSVPQPSRGSSGSGVPRPPSPGVRVSAAGSGASAIDVLPAQEYVVLEDASSAGGIPRSNPTQIIVGSHEDAFIQAHPEFEGRIQGKQNEAIFMSAVMTVGPLAFPEGEAAELAIAEVSGATRAEEIAVALYHAASPAVQATMLRAKLPIGVVTRDGTSVIATNNPEIYKALVGTVESGAVKLAPGEYLASPPIRSGAIPHPDWSRQFVDAEVQAEYELSEIFGLTGPGTASSFPVPGCEWCVPWLYSKGIIHLNPSPRAPLK